MSTIPRYIPLNERIYDDIRSKIQPIKQSIQQYRKMESKEAVSPQVRSIIDGIPEQVQMFLKESDDDKLNIPETTDEPALSDTSQTETNDDEPDLVVSSPITITDAGLDVISDSTKESEQPSDSIETTIAQVAALAIVNSAAEKKAATDLIESARIESEQIAEKKRKALIKDKEDIKIHDSTTSNRNAFVLAAALSLANVVDGTGIVDNIESTDGESEKNEDKKHKGIVDNSIKKNISAQDMQTNEDYILDTMPAHAIAQQSSTISITNPDMKPCIDAFKTQSDIIPFGKVVDKNNKDVCLGIYEKGDGTTEITELEIDEASYSEHIPVAEAHIIESGQDTDTSSKPTDASSKPADASSKPTDTSSKPTGQSDLQSISMAAALAIASN